MKPKREEFSTGERAFRILLDPNLNDVFYWHFHPELELVYVEAEQGFRHIGDHLSRYEGSDLALIGPNIPHLNFDYGVRTQVGTVVIQMKEDFLGAPFMSLHETNSIRQLFERSRSGLAFSGEVKRQAGEKLKMLPALPELQQLLTLLEVLDLLSQSTESMDLGARPVSEGSVIKEQQRLNLVYRFVEENYHRDVDVHEVAALCCLTTPAFCRYFRKASGYTFTDFLNRYRINQACKMLMLDKPVGEACFSSGFNNFSHFSKTFRKFTGLNPTGYIKNFNPASHI